MNKINYQIKYIEYLLRKCRTILTNDISFHADRLREISGTYPDLLNPVTLNEKICHRILFIHNPFYTLLADKLLVRQYVEKRTNLIKLIPLVGVYNRVDDIDFDKLPSKFVLKCNHDSGSAVICTDKTNIDPAKVKSKLKLSLKKNMYYTTREWQYKNIPPVILCEMYLDLFSSKHRNITPEMIRIHCFHGVACFIEADFTDSDGNEFINVYDRAWNLQPFQGNDSNLLIVFYVQIVPDDFVMQLHRFGERQGLPAQPCQMLSQIQVVSLNSLRVTLTDDVQFSLQT
ncbi:glycosyltransferase [Klebsiella pneumoniae]|nr:glycosyltransferase [Klebsiella pneumoniae]